MTDLTFRVSGSEDGRALMLIHAFGANLSFWDDMIGDLGPRFRCARYDIRGLGTSPIAPRKWTMDEHVNDLEEVRKATSLSRFNLIGTAIGGAIALFYAHRYPERVQSVIFVNPTMGANPKTNTERAAKAVAEGMSAIAEPSVSRAFGELPHDARYLHFRDEIFAKNSPIGYQRSIMGLIEKDVREVLPEIKCPVLLLGGRLDTINPPSVVEEIAGMLPDAQIAWVENGAHFAPYQASAECADAIRKFLEPLAEECI